MPCVTVHGELVVGEGNRAFLHLFNTIEKKIWRRQLQGLGPAVLAIRLRHFIIPFLPDGEIAAFADSLAECVLDCLEGVATEISGVLLVEEWRDRHKGDARISKPAYSAIKNQDEDDSVRFVSLVKNPCATAPLTDEEIERLAGDRMVW